MSAGSSSSPKRSGSKPKGAVRAKSGCYTCRIRRKKCDEKADETGSCQTCARLRLQCLGFGAKRPDWMREGNSVAEMREKIKTFLASNGMIKGHSAAALRSAGQTLSIPDAGTSSSTALPSASNIGIRPLPHDVGHDNVGLNTPLSATSTLTPEDRSDSSLSPPSSHASNNSFVNSLPFPPGYVGTSSRMHGEQGLGSPPGENRQAGVLFLSEGRPLPESHSHVPTSRHPRRARNDVNPAYSVNLVEGPSDEAGPNGNGISSINTNNDTRRGTSISFPFSRYFTTPRSTTMPTHDPTSSASCPSGPSRFPHGSTATSHSYLGEPRPHYSYPPTRSNANSTSNACVSSPTSASLSSACSSPSMPCNDTPFTPCTPLPSLPLLSAGYKPPSDVAWFSTATPTLISSPMDITPTGLYSFSPRPDADVSVDMDMRWATIRPNHFTNMNGPNNVVHAFNSNVHIKTEPDAISVDLSNARSTYGSNMLTHNSNVNSSLRPRPSTDDGCADPIPNALNMSTSSNYNYLAYPSVYNNNANNHLTGGPFDPSTAVSTPLNIYDTSTSMAVHTPSSNHGYTSTEEPQYHHQPQLSPDSPTPNRHDDPMIGAYAAPPATSHLVNQGQSAGQAYMSIAHHAPGQFAQHAPLPRHIAPDHGGFDGIGHGSHAYGPNRGYGPAQPSSSWTGEDNGRVTNYQQDSSQFVQQQQQQQPDQAHVQQQCHGWTQANNSNESGALQFPDSSPTVVRADLPPPNIQSSFGPLYNYNPTMEEFAYNETGTFTQQAPMDALELNVNGVGGALVPFYGHGPAPISGMEFFSLSHEQQRAIYQEVSVSRPLGPALIDAQYIDRRDGPLMEHYLQHVLPVQYFFLNERVIEHLRRLAISDKAVRDAICSVASVHKRHMREGTIAFPSNSPNRALVALTAGTGAKMAPEGDDGGIYFSKLQVALKGTTPDKYTEAEALAGLQCISSFLFAGGLGDWDSFLNLACNWVDNVFARLRASAGDMNLLNALTQMKYENEIGTFVVRTTMWFEVLASVTMVRAPRFLEVYRLLFTPSARIVEVDGEAANAESEFSMLEVMGCDNPTFLALAEISTLAAWKNEQERNQSLSMVELVRQGLDIERRCLGVISDGGVKRNGDGSALEKDSLENRRRLTADIFRATARLYLQAVLSGDYPKVREIYQGVQSTIEALRRIPLEPASLRRSVVRSAVFPICLAGSLTDDPSERAMVEGLLKDEGGAGNCGSVMAVMAETWERRDAKSRGGGGVGKETADEVSWRTVLRGGGVPILLV